MTANLIMSEIKKIIPVASLFLAVIFVVLVYIDQPKSKTEPKLESETVQRARTSEQDSKSNLEPKIHKVLSNIQLGVKSVHCLQSCPGGKTENTLIKRNIYILSNNATTKFADWVAYVVTPETIGRSKRRRWRADPKLKDEETLEPNDYKGAHYALKTDRGHQVPLASFSSTPYWHETNYLSNITPQSSNLNQGCWVRLETKVRKLAYQYNAVYVISGPLYLKKMQALPRADESHKVPSGYWKIVSVKTPNSNTPYSHTAFLFPQGAKRRDHYCKYRSSIEKIEQASGLSLAKLKSKPSLLCSEKN